MDRPAILVSTSMATLLTLAILLIWIGTPHAGVVFDDFERHMLGPDWVVLSGSGSLGLVSQSDLGLVAGPARGGAVEWTADAFGPDQFSEAVISPGRIDSILTQVFVRHRASDNARYGFHWNNALGGRYEIKYDGVPTPETRILAFAAAPEPTPGDRLRIEARGSTIYGYRNGTLILSADDTAPEAISAGSVGMVFRFSTTFPAQYPVSAFEEWSGGDLTAASVPGTGGAALALGIVPNPVTSTSAILVRDDIAAAGEVTLTLYDASGRAAAIIPNSAGARLRREGHAAGVYYYILSRGPACIARGRLVIE